MKKSIGLAILLGIACILPLLPMTAGAALTPPSLGSYLQYATESNNDALDSPNKYEIVGAAQGYQGTGSGYYYFLLEMQSTINKNNSASAYQLHVGGLTFQAEPVFDPGPAPSSWTLTPSPFYGDFGSADKSLEWKLSAADYPGLGPASEWWFEAYGGATINDSTEHLSLATPIPGTVWLLGAGLVGLVGLRRRKNGNA